MAYEFRISGKAVVEDPNADEASQQSTDADAEAYEVAMDAIRTLRDAGHEVAGDFNGAQLRVEEDRSNAREEGVRHPER